MKKKLLALLLVLCMVLSIVPATMLSVLAEEGEALPSSTFTRDAFGYDLTTFAVQLPEGWSMNAYDSGDYFMSYPMDTVMCGDHDNTSTPGLGAEGGYILVDGLDWGTTPRIPVLGKYDRADWHGVWLGLGAKDGYNVAYTYVAPETGYVDVSIDALRYYHPDTFTNLELKALAVFVGGEMVWPTAGGSYTDLEDWILADEVVTEITEELYDVENRRMGERGTVANADMLKNIFVSAGEKVELMVKSTTGSVGNATQTDLTVQYTSVLAAPTATASVALGEKFAVHFDVTADESASEYGIYVNGQKQPADYVIEDLVAAELGITTFLYAPYQIIDGNEIKAEPKSITPLEILEQYTAENGCDEKTVALAEATILYASMAEAYFEEFDLMADLKEIVDTMGAPEAKNAKITDAIEETATFIRANLYLNDSMDMKFFFTAENASDLTVKVEGAGDVTVTVEEAGSGYVAIVEDIPMSAYGTDLKVTVYDGETAISETLTYSVEIYAARMYEADATGIDQLALNDLLKTIVNLGKAAAAYNA